MTQVKSAQGAGKNLALHEHRDSRTLAQRRADYAAQMRAMALSDLEEVKRRLKGLHEELERKDGRKIKQYELAHELKIPPRTFQSWENGEVENTDGKGYDKIARHYSRKLGRKITRQWILFGDDAGLPSESVEGSSEPAATDDEFRAALEELLDGQAELLSMLSEVRDEQARLSRLQAPGERGEEGTGS